MRVSRRSLITGAATGLAVLTATGQVPKKQTDLKFKITKGRIRQSVMGWCFKSKPNPVDGPTLAKMAAEIGLAGIEGISRQDYPAARKLGLAISLVSSHGFKTGPYSREQHQYCRDKLVEAIDIAAEVRCPSVITFTGFSVKGTGSEQGAKNCVELWKSVMSHANKKKINLVLEHLNTRDDSHPMKGHPGYFGDDIDQCADLVRRVGSPHMKLLFDIYHVQIMNGDVIRRIRQYQDLIGHYHTAGNPGRAELARAVKVLVEASWPIAGCSDHGVSEAVYLADPDGNGIELCWDRPMDEWPRSEDGALAMFSRAFTVEQLLEST